MLDFLSRPGFRSLVLGQAFELPRENGYSFLTKWQFALIEAESFGKLDSEVGPARSSDGESLVIEPATRNILALAEQTTGKSMKYFLESVDAKAIRSELQTLERSQLGYDTSHIVNPLLSFSALQGLTILLGEVCREHGGKIPDGGDFSLLHCLCVPVGDMGAPGRASHLVFGQNFDVDLSERAAPMISFLVQHGARLNARYKGDTAWGILFRRYHYSKFLGTDGNFDESPTVNALVRAMLGAGQDPDVDIKLRAAPRRRGKKGPEYVAGRALPLPR